MTVVILVLTLMLALMLVLMVMTETMMTPMVIEVRFFSEAPSVVASLASGVMQGLCWI